MLLQDIDDHTVHITTTGPDPLLWLKLADVAIMSQAWAEEHNVTKAVGLMLFPVHLFP